ncbi:hypothetical protein Tco_0047810 [Tanacetum coccineum]
MTHTKDLSCPHVRISSISLGNNVTDANLLKLLLSGIDNVKEKVKGLGIKGVKVSTTVSLAFVNSKDIVAKELLGGLSEKDATLFVNVKHWNVSLGPFKEVVCCGFALKRDLSADVGYVSLDNNGEMMDYRVVEVRVFKVEEDKVKKDDDVDAIYNIGMKQNREVKVSSASNFRTFQKAIAELAMQFDNASTAKDDLRKAYEKCNDIPQENRALIDIFLKQESDKDYKMYLVLFRNAAKIEQQMSTTFVWLWEKYN